MSLWLLPIFLWALGNFSGYMLPECQWNIFCNDYFFGTIIFASYINFMTYEFCSPLYLLQVYDDTEEGSKVCTYYKLDSIPVILVIDPITGQKLHSWRGMVQPEKLLEVNELFTLLLCTHACKHGYSLVLFCKTNTFLPLWGNLLFIAKGKRKSICYFPDQGIYLTWVFIFLSLGSATIHGKHPLW